jgi:hypothetical protein
MATLTKAIKRGVRRLSFAFPIPFQKISYTPPRNEAFSIHLAFPAPVFRELGELCNASEESLFQWPNAGKTVRCNALSGEFRTRLRCRWQPAQRRAADLHLEAPLFCADGTLHLQTSFLK